MPDPLWIGASLGNIGGKSGWSDPPYVPLAVKSTGTWKFFSPMLFIAHGATLDSQALWALGNFQRANGEEQDNDKCNRPYDASGSSNIERGS